MTATKVLDLTRHSYSRAAYAASADNLIRNAETQLRGQQIDFDSMVAVGHSGLLVLPVLARHFNVPFFGVRKMETSSHNSSQPQGDGIIGRKWILVDDFTVTGNTIAYAREKIAELSEIHNFTTEFMGAYFYEPVGMTPGEFRYPDGRKVSLRKIKVDGLTEYVDSAIYAKVEEVIELRDLSVSDTVIYVKNRYPSWDTDILYSTALYLSQNKDLHV